MTQETTWIAMAALGLCAGLLWHWGLRRLQAWLAELEGSEVTLPAYLVDTYSLVLVHGLIGLACAVHWPNPVTAFAWAMFGSALLMLSLVDWHTTWLPDVLTQPLLWAGLFVSLQGWIPTPLEQAVIGAMLGYGVLWSTATLFGWVTGKVGMGGGDFKLLAALGTWLGPWAVIPLLMLASTAGALVGLWLKHRSGLRDGGYLPFGPFLAAAACVLAWVSPEAWLAFLGA